MEVWRDIYFEENGIIYDYRGLYQVSNEGKVKSLGNEKTRKERILKEGKHKSGYLQVNLCKDGKVKKFYVHRLVAFMFIENNDPLNKTQINHIDEDKTNNCVENLEWMTSKENNNHGTRNERVSENHPNKKRVICINTGKIYSSAMEAERQTGVSHQNIIECCQGKYKSAGIIDEKPAVWMYLDEYEKLTEIEIERIKNQEVPNVGRPKQVICLNTGKIYSSAMEAERQTGVDVSSIIKCCRGKLKSAGKLNGEKLIWRYHEED